MVQYKYFFVIEELDTLCDYKMYLAEEPISTK